MLDYASWPYGLYSLPDRVVVHDRKYRPLAAIRRGGPNAIHVPAHTRDRDPVMVTIDPATAVPVPADTWIDHDKSVDAYFYSDCTSPRRSAATRKLLRSLVEAVPALADAVKRRANAR